MTFSALALAFYVSLHTSVSMFLVICNLSKHLIQCHPCLQLNDPLEAEVIVKKITGRKIMFETVCRRSSDGTVLVDGAALARMRL